MGEPHPGRVKTAFVAGAGLGKRLRPMTDHRPKPLVPVFNRPLITYVFDQLIAAGIERVVVNTHHCAGAYATILGACDDRLAYGPLDVTFVHEPVLLETAGGIGNAAFLFPDEPVLIHNGDVLASVDLRQLIQSHQGSGCEVSVHLRSSGGPLQVQFDRTAGRVTDFRGTLGASCADAVPALFTGAYVLEPSFVARIPRGEILSVIPIFLDMLRSGDAICGFLDDSGVWADLGNRESYLDAHAAIPVADFSHWGVEFSRDRIQIAATARIGRDVQFDGFVSVGENAVIGDGARIRDSILWEGAEIASGSDLRRCIVRDNEQASGLLVGQDI